MHSQTRPNTMNFSITAPSPSGSRACQPNTKRVGFMDYFLNCLLISRQRMDLLALDDEALKDIGISRSEARREANRSFWDIPRR